MFQLNLRPLSWEGQRRPPSVRTGSRGGRPSNAASPGPSTSPRGRLRPPPPSRPRRERTTRLQGPGKASRAGHSVGLSWVHADGPLNRDTHDIDGVRNTTPTSARGVVQNHDNTRPHKDRIWAKIGRRSGPRQQNQAPPHENAPRAPLPLRLKARFPDPTVRSSVETPRSRAPHMQPRVTQESESTRVAPAEVPAGDARERPKRAFNEPCIQNARGPLVEHSSGSYPR